MRARIVRWIVLAVAWSSASHWVLGVPFDMVMRARRQGGQAAADLEDLARIFEPFVQVDARLTRTEEGTGLGLAISRDLARGMGGDLTAESEVGEGSTFTLVLPAADDTA